MSRMKQASKREAAPLVVVCLLQLAASIIRETLASEPVAIGIAIAMQIVGVTVLVWLLVKWVISVSRKQNTGNK